MSYITIIHQLINIIIETDLSDKRESYFMIHDVLTVNKFLFFYFRCRESIMSL